MIVDVTNKSKVGTAKQWQRSGVVAEEKINFLLTSSDD